MLVCVRVNARGAIYLIPLGPPFSSPEGLVRRSSPREKKMSTLGSALHPAMSLSSLPIHLSVCIYSNLLLLGLLVGYTRVVL